MTDLKTTKLHAKHVALGAKMAPFAGYDMPAQYPLGVVREHNHTREKAGLFDVSHMGQCFVIPVDGHYKTAATALERLVPADIQSLKPGQTRYSQLLNADGGTLDDLMISRLGFEGHEHKLYLVVNASCKDANYAHMLSHLPENVFLDYKDDDLSLLALQGPRAAQVLGALCPAVNALTFMTHTDAPIMLPSGPTFIHVSRSGYTGEDGFEISVKHDDVLALTEALLTHPDVEMIGLGARDSLRMEAGLCLYGHELSESVSPVEAGLIRSIPKHRRSANAGYLGAVRVASDLADKTTKRLIGILPDGADPARKGTEIQDGKGNTIGVITSGGFGPTVARPIAMGFVACEFTKSGTAVTLIVDGKVRPAKTVKMPFTPHNYHLRD